MNNDRSVFLLILQLAVITGLLVLSSVDDPFQSLLRWVLFTALFVITGFLLFITLRSRTRMKLMIAEIRRAVNGNLKTRLFSKQDDHLFEEMIFSVNELIEQLEKIQVQAIKSQEGRRRLLSSISHDIRTPLTSIIGYVDALKDDIATSEEEKREYIGIISKKSNGLKQLIDEIFTMAKLDADEIPLKIESLDFAEIVRESLIEFLPEIKKHDLELKVIIPEEKYMITADRLSLMRIIGNIVKNAIHYGKRGKTLGIELTEKADEYQLLIWDQGPGISQVDIGNVFERMHRSDGARNLSHGGSGLGLAIAKALVEKNNGRIWVESIPWEKTTFGFSIPKHNQ